MNEQRSLIATMANRYQLDAATFQATLRKTVMPSGITNEQLAAFLLVANQHDLNPITREIHAFPTKGGGIQPVVGIDGWIKLAQRHPEFDGMDFRYDKTKDGDVTACTCAIWRKDRSRPTQCTEFMDECKRPTEPWKTHPRRMLRHKAAIQAIRYAFGFTGISDEDDASLIVEKNVTPESSVSDDLKAQIHSEDPWPHWDESENAWIDSNGETFNANDHAWSGKDNKPSVKADGTFRQRRKPKAQHQPQSAINVESFERMIATAKDAAELQEVKDLVDTMDGADKAIIDDLSNKIAVRYQEFKNADG